MPQLRGLLAIYFTRSPLCRALVPSSSAERELLPRLFSYSLARFFRAYRVCSSDDRLGDVLIISSRDRPCGFLRCYLARTETTLAASK